MDDLTGPAGRSNAPEHRTFRIGGLEWRDPGETGGDWSTLTGHAAVFDRQSLPLYDWWYGEYNEEIAPGAFRNVLATNPDVHLVYVHDMASAMARTASKTLELTEDQSGLKVWAKLDPSDLDVQRIAPKMRRGDVDQMSFAFTVAQDADGNLREEWHVAGDTVTRRILEIGGLYDVSVVPQGAYPQTGVELNQRAIRSRIAVAMKREGKILSASSRTTIQAAVDSLQELLDSAETERGRAAAAQLRELRADMPSLLCLTEMWELGQDFIDCEDDPDDGPDRAAMQAVLSELEKLIQTEASEDEGAEDEGAESEGRSRARAALKRRAEKAGANTIAQDGSAGGADARQLAALRARARARLTTL